MKSKSKKTKIEEPLSSNPFKDIFFPMVKRIMGSTIRLDLVNVQPMDGVDSETRKKIKAEVKAENRNKKIDSILQDKPFEQMKIQEHPEWKDGPSPKLFYLDFTYGTPHASIRWMRIFFIPFFRLIKY